MRTIARDGTSWCSIVDLTVRRGTGTRGPDARDPCEWLAPITCAGYPAMLPVVNVLGTLAGGITAYRGS